MTRQMDSGTLMMEWTLRRHNQEKVVQLNEVRAVKRAATLLYYVLTTARLNVFAADILLSAGYLTRLSKSPGWLSHFRGHFLPVWCKIHWWKIPLAMSWQCHY